MYVFSEEKQEILKLPDGENQEQSIPWWVKQVAYILFALTSFLEFMMLFSLPLVSSKHLLVKRTIITAILP